MLHTKREAQHPAPSAPKIEKDTCNNVKLPDTPRHVEAIDEGNNDPTVRLQALRPEKRAEQKISSETI